MSATAPRQSEPFVALGAQPRLQSNRLLVDGDAELCHLARPAHIPCRTCAQFCAFLGLDAASRNRPSPDWRTTRSDEPATRMLGMPAPRPDDQISVRDAFLAMRNFLYPYWEEGKRTDDGLSDVLSSSSLRIWK